MTSDKDTPYARFLQSIHDASSGLPLVLVLAGLSDTKDTAIRMGLTRGLTIHNIHCLSEPERNALMTEFCRKFEVDADGYEPFLYDLAKPTEGWPRHLHFTLKALVEEVLRVNGELGGVNWAYVHTVSAQGRLSYYQHQQSTVLCALKPLVGEVMHDLKTGDSFKTITNRIRRYVTSDMLYDLPDDMHDIRLFPRQLVQEMSHQGAIQEYETDMFFSPIPSFRSHLIKEGIMDSTNMFLPRNPFKLYYGTMLNEEKDGFASYAEARTWALEKIEHMSDEEDISLWYGEIHLETLRLRTPPLLKTGDGDDTSLGP